MNKFTLLAASTAIAMVSGTQAFAQNPYNAAEIRGNGASGVSIIVAETMNCFGGPNNGIGLNTLPLTINPVADHVYTPSKPTNGNPAYNCATMSIQDAVEGKYVSTGSGGGRNSWRNLTAAGITNNPFGTWSNVQFAWSEAPASAGDITTYNTAALPTAGAPIQLPLVIFSVGFSYLPAYGKINTGTGVEELTFNVKFPRTTQNLGGLRLSRASYCGIVNGTITNWNAPQLQADNGNQSLRDPDDSVTRWDSVGVPIKLVGRSDSSGTTNVLSRALATQCGGKFPVGDNSVLPVAARSTAVYSNLTGLLTAGTETAGLFGLSAGNEGVAAAVSQDIPTPVNTGDVTLGGWLGYNGADFLAPTVIANGKQLHSAALQIGGAGSKYASPVAKDAALAFKNILPPQSTSKGTYDPANTANGLRNNPLAWVVPANATGAGTLADPTSGYPIVGTGNILTYTCFASADVRKAMQSYLSLFVGKVAAPDNTLDGAPAKVPAKLVTSTSTSATGSLIGLLANNGFAPMPSAWTKAINETFLTNVTKAPNPGALNLWIQNKLQKKPTDVLLANPNCTPNVGA